MNDMILYIIAGANGSGKSTLVSELLPDKHLEFLNADNIESVKIQAGKVFLEKLDKLLNLKKSFAIETTLAGKIISKQLQKLKNWAIKLSYFILI